MLVRLLYALLFLFCRADGLQGRFAHRKAVPSNDNGQLVFVQALWRHGDRSPTMTFPADNNTWPNGWGQLSLRGMQQHLLLGQRLKAKYTTKLGFTPAKYNQAEVYVRSTDLNRTLQSAMSNLVGFFSPGEAGVDYPKADGWLAGYVPVPIHTIDDDYDYLINPDRICPRNAAFRKFLNNCKDVKTIADEHKDLLDTITKISGLKVNIWNIWQVADAWFIDRLYNKTLPPEFTDDLFNKVTELNEGMDDVDYGIGVEKCEGVDVRTELTKLRGGPLLWSMIDHMQEKRFCLNTPVEQRDAKAKKLCNWMDPLKYYVYSAHDTTIAALFATFGFNETNFDEPGFPHYSACVTIEMWKAPSGSYYTKAFYWVPPNSTESNRTNDDDLIDLTADIEGCSSAECDLDEFAKRSKRYKLETTAAKLCDDDHIGPGSFSIRTNAAFSALLFTFFLLLW